DVAKQCGKDVALEISGQTTDLDKGILDALAEPLMHLVRNAVDHGVGSPEERLAAGKPARGTVYLNAYHQGTQVVMEVRDDGRGIDLAVIRARAVEKGIVKAEEVQRLNEQDVVNLIFESGFSTAKEVPEVLRLREQVLMLVRLNHLSRLRSIDPPSAKKRSFVIVIGAAEKRFGLVVDSLVGEEELVIKALPGEIVSSDLVSGASILGDG